MKFELVFEQARAIWCSSMRRSPPTHRASGPPTAGPRSPRPALISNSFAITLRPWWPRALGPAAAGAQSPGRRAAANPDRYLDAYSRPTRGIGSASFRPGPSRQAPETRQRGRAGCHDPRYFSVWGFPRGVGCTSRRDRRGFAAPRAAGVEAPRVRGIDPPMQFLCSPSSAVSVVGCGRH